jgi:hypothetical protein
MLITSELSTFDKQCFPSEGLSGIMYDVLLTILDMFMLKKTSKIQQITPISFME